MRKGLMILLIVIAVLVVVGFVGYQYEMSQIESGVATGIKNFW